MRKQILKWKPGMGVLPVLALALTGSCASTSSLTHDDILRQYDAIAQLDAGVASARSREAAVLAPDLFTKTRTSLDMAVEHARDAEKDQAIRTANRGLEELNALNEMVESNGQVMEEVMMTRSRAQEQGAPSLFSSDFNRADAALSAATRLLENNQRDEAKDRRSKLMQTYADLELRALKMGLTAAATDAVAIAEEADADDYAPKTLESATQELELATSVLEADRTRVDDSNAHARKAIWLARRAQEITATAKRFEQEDFTSEDIILWHQSMLQAVRKPVSTRSLPFDRPEAEVVAALKGDVAALVNSTQDLHKANRLSQEHIQSLEDQLSSQALARRQELATILRDHEKQQAALRSGNQAQIQQARTAAAEQVAALQQKLSEETKALEEAARREREGQARYSDIRAMFAPNEADVLREGVNVLIRLKGFQFRPGQSEIEAKNFALLNKVLWALNVFPKGQVTVSGHTDSSGSPENNLMLSQKRAEGVAKFLTSIGGFQSSQLTAEGRGEDEPIATNETADGRAANRRIDVWITN